MPRWKALPDELDPQVKEFAVQLRRLVDRSGLGVAAVADRTGYSRTSWERYLNGRLLAPKGAVVALAEVTGTSPVHLATMWELAERAWSRSEMRHDMTMEAIRISQARAALGEFGPPPVNGSDRGRGRGGRGATATPGAAGTAGGVPSVPRQPTAADVEDSGSGASVASSPGSPSGGASRRGGGDQRKRATPEAAKGSASVRPDLPAGVKCGGEDCTGKDPEKTGCGGRSATTPTSITVGTTLVEVRYSGTCGAAWARITRAVAGDSVVVSAGAADQRAGVKGDDTDAYTPMVAVGDGAGASTPARHLTACTPAAPT
ncbi:XRE family transcriptional regulator, partial [Streptomyces sp. me109]|uniref:helix-turn-helix domain-containing protein n=1 Tax=Streptomyces sp. me109 TaxID=1827853 RepID=UPI0011CE6C36